MYTRDEPQARRDAEVGEANHEFGTDKPPGRSMEYNHSCLSDAEICIHHSLAIQAILTVHRARKCKVPFKNPTRRFTRPVGLRNRLMGDPVQ